MKSNPQSPSPAFLPIPLSQDPYSFSFPGFYDPLSCPLITRPHTRKKEEEKWNREVIATKTREERKREVCRSISRIPLQGEPPI